MTALAVSRRGERSEAHLATARRIADTVVYGTHGFSHPEGEYFPPATRFVDVVNACLAKAETPYVLKVDDHDFYPEDHARLIDYWSPGVCVWGTVEARGCDGSYCGTGRSMCATVFPSDLVLEPDRWGMLTQSLREQTREVVVPSGVIKTMCPGDWSWGLRPGTHRKINCQHGN